MNKIEICSCEEKKRSTYLLFSKRQLQKIYDVKKIFIDPCDPFDEDVVCIEKPRTVFHVRCKICELYPRFTDDSDFWQIHTRKHIKSGFIDRDGTHLRMRYL
ncbi:hypothetical protein OROMI_025295 [Orobanche minor]